MKKLLYVLSFAALYFAAVNAQSPNPATPPAASAVEAAVEAAVTAAEGVGEAVKAPSTETVLNSLTTAFNTITSTVSSQKDVGINSNSLNTAVMIFNAVTAGVEAGNNALKTNSTGIKAALDAASAAAISSVASQNLPATLTATIAVAAVNQFAEKVNATPTDIQSALQTVKTAVETATTVASVVK